MRGSLAVLLFSTVASACTARPHAAEETPPRETSSVSTRPAPAALGFEFLEVETGGAGADDALPLILALHGLGDAPGSFAGLFSGFPCPSRVVIPHSETHYGEGYSWFEFRREDPDFAAPVITRRADALTAFVAALSKRRPTTGRPIVTGFSQGGALSFAIAARHAREIAAAFPIGGWLPAAVPEAPPGPSPAPVVAFHGTADPVVAVTRARTAAERLSASGVPTELREFAGVGHAIPPPVRAAYFERLAAACERERRAGPR